VPRNSKQRKDDAARKVLSTVILHFEIDHPAPREPAAETVLDRLNALLKAVNKRAPNDFEMEKARAFARVHVQIAHRYITKALTDIMVETLVLKEKGIDDDKEFLKVIAEAIAALQPLRKYVEALRRRGSAIPSHLLPVTWQELEESIERFKWSLIPEEDTVRRKAENVAPPRSRDENQPLRFLVHSLFQYGGRGIRDPEIAMIASLTLEEDVTTEKVIEVSPHFDTTRRQAKADREQLEEARARWLEWPTKADRELFIAECEAAMAKGRQGS
jgi:hypothetical protein